MAGVGRTPASVRLVRRGPDGGIADILLGGDRRGWLKSFTGLGGCSSRASTPLEWPGDCGDLCCGDLGWGDCTEDDAGNSLISCPADLLKLAALVGLTALVLPAVRMVPLAACRSAVLGRLGTAVAAIPLLGRDSRACETACAALDAVNAAVGYATAAPGAALEASVARSSMSLYCASALLCSRNEASMARAIACCSSWSAAMKAAVLRCSSAM